MDKQVLCILGGKGAGKDTCADFILKEHGKDATKLSCASRLKRLTIEIYGSKIANISSIYGTQAQKEAPILSWCMPETAKKVLKTDSKYWSGRLLLQYVGTELLRDSVNAPTLWIDYLVEDIEASKEGLIVLTDIRFWAEIEVLNKLNAKHGYNVMYCRLNKKELEGINDPHSSEQEYKNFPYDFEIDNNWSRAILNKEITNISRMLLNGNKTLAEVYKLEELKCTTNT